LLSWLGVDAAAQRWIVARGAGRSLPGRSPLASLVDSMMVAVPYWATFEAAILRPALGGAPRWPVLLVVALCFLVKVFAWRAWIWEEKLDESSRWWSPSLARIASPSALAATWRSSAFPSLHTAATLALAWDDPHARPLAVVVPVWMVLASHHWFSDVLAGALVATGIMLAL
jgi:membrane-associated phospholipid phosphatase